MKLVKFKDYRDLDLYIDPEAVVGVAAGKVYMFGREECLFVKADADEIISKIGADVDDSRSALGLDFDEERLNG